MLFGDFRPQGSSDCTQKISRDISNVLSLTSGSFRCQQILAEALQKTTTIRSLPTDRPHVPILTTNCHDLLLILVRSQNQVVPRSTEKCHGFRAFAAESQRAILLARLLESNLMEDAESVAKSFLKKVHLNFSPTPHRDNGSTH